MNKRIVALFAGSLLLLYCGAINAGSPRQSVVTAFIKDIAAKSQAAEKNKLEVIRGKDNWLFYRHEVRSQSVGPFWGPAARKVDKAVNPDHADPLPVILDFKEQLDRAGIELLLVPAPPKTAVYPEMISNTISLGKGAAPPRLDIYDEQFYQILKAHGVHVLDLMPFFIQHRFDYGQTLYYPQDTHWTSQACDDTAVLISRELAGRPWLSAVPKRDYVRHDAVAAVKGDMSIMLGDKSPPTQMEPYIIYQERTMEGNLFGKHPVLHPITVWRESPVVMIGDSFTSGLQEPLSRHLGFPIDLVTVFGSGGQHARINLIRRGDGLAGKRLVIWCFNVREFTESPGWTTLNINPQR